LSSSLETPLKVGDIIIEKDPKYMRPIEVEFLLADATKAHERLGWVPKVAFNELVRIMVDSDMELLGMSPQGEGKKILNEKGIHWTKNKIVVG
jgi:GDPmannose 4,6-dehydratase